MPLPVHPPLLGSNEHRLPGSPAAFIARLNEALRPMADAAGVDLLALDARAALRRARRVARSGAVAPREAGGFARRRRRCTASSCCALIAARQGRSCKCLVLDLDNTLWGGVIGDDGLEGIVLGQGSALGEAYVAFQDYARELARRGVILAVCSKNDEANALEPFERHPEMVLRRADIASFVANWSDKAGNIRAIAEELNIGLDALVFVDDNPFERNLVRQELPMVAVPEVTGRSRAAIRAALADAGYFEALCGHRRGPRAHACSIRATARAKRCSTSATDLPAYLRGLEMQLRWRRFDRDRPAAHRAAHQQDQPVQPDHAPLHRGRGAATLMARPARVRPATAPDRPVRRQRHHRHRDRPAAAQTATSRSTPG